MSEKVSVPAKRSNEGTSKRRLRSIKREAPKKQGKLVAAPDAPACLR